jgi:hypothetical protein
MNGKSDIVYEEKISINQIVPSLSKKLVTMFDLGSIWMQKLIRTEHMSGPTSAKSVSVRTGALRASVIPIRTEIKGDSIQAGVSIGGDISKGGGTPAGRYAGVHVGGYRSTVITAKNKKFLTIPLPAAKTRAGVGKAPAASDAFWGETFVAKSKQGNLIIFGREKFVGGKKKGEFKTPIVPLFLLKKTVSVPARIHPDEILAAFGAKLTKDLSTLGIDIGK